jgi:hypothetical protein
MNSVEQQICCTVWPVCGQVGEGMEVYTGFKPDFYLYPGQVNAC